MRKVIILKGIPASGKSTYAEELVRNNPDVYKRINRDSLRHMFDGYHLSKDNEKFVKRVRDMLISEALRNKRDVIVDDTNLSEKNINRIQQLADIHKKSTGEEVELEVKEFNIDVDEAIKRDSLRERPVGSRVIRSMHAQFYEGSRLGRGPHYKVQDANLPPAIICDLDGTLAIIKDRNPYEEEKCESDTLNEPIAEIVRDYHEKGYQVLLLSGRQEKGREATEKWLATHEIPYHALWMRTNEDNRKDSVIKKELVQEKIWNRFLIKFVLDDRNQVVDMWRNEIGVACLQVNYGDF